VLSCNGMSPPTGLYTEEHMSTVTIAGATNGRLTEELDQRLQRDCSNLRRQVGSGSRVPANTSPRVPHTYFQSACLVNSSAIGVFKTETLFTVLGPWLRDQYFCSKRKSIPRQRAINLVLQEYFPNWRSLVLHESSPSNDFIARWCSSYSCSAMFDDVPQAHQGRRAYDAKTLSK
jgi:hypothetical protein